MCDTCGCNQADDSVKIFIPDHSSNKDKIEQLRSKEEHHHHHENNEHTHSRVISVEKDILQKNNLLAERNRGYFEAKSIFSINLMSSPGSGKTTFLEKLISDMKDDNNFYVIEGDQQTSRDAERIQKTGTPVIQVNTGNGCHLDAAMVNKALKKLQPSENSFLLIENVGNLVCPSLFDLGESKRIVIISVTEGDDKPAKYPSIFDSADICIINKIDLLPYVDFDIKKCKNYGLQVNHHLEFFEISAKTGEGMEDIIIWFKKQAPPYFLL